MVWQHMVHFLEAVAQRCSVKKVFLEISQNSQNTLSYRIPLVAASDFFMCMGGYHSNISIKTHTYDTYLNYTDEMLFGFLWDIMSHQ